MVKVTKGLKPEARLGDRSYLSHECTVGLAMINSVSRSETASASLNLSHECTTAPGSKSQLSRLETGFAGFSLSHEATSATGRPLCRGDPHHSRSGTALPKSNVSHGHVGPSVVGTVVEFGEDVC